MNENLVVNALWICKIPPLSLNPTKAKKREDLLLISHSGPSISSRKRQMGISNQQDPNMLIKNKSSKGLAKASLTMPGKDIIAAFSPMDKQDQENHTV